MQTPPIQPFWHRLRAISLYPAHPTSLMTIGVLALCHLARFLPFGFWLDVLVWVALYTYAFECLRASADGRLEPPEPGINGEDGLGWKQIWLQFFFGLFGVLGFVLFGPIGGMIVLVALGLALPGAIMALAMDQNLGHALNPATWLAVFTRIGWPYIAVVALCFVFFASRTYAQMIAVNVLPAFVAIIVVNFIAHYAIVATFHLMGYLIYQYHDEVGYEPATSHLPLPSHASDPDQATLDEAAHLLREGQPDAARELIGNHLRARGGSDGLHAQYRKLLALGDQRAEQLRHGREWIGVLLAQDKDRRAVDVARECLELDAAFEPVHRDHVGRVAQKAADAGASQVALKLVAGFHKRYPKHADIPKNYLLAAKLLAERMGKDAEARALLEQLARAYPQHPLAPDITAYRQFLDKLVATAVPAR